MQLTMPEKNRKTPRRALWLAGAGVLLAAVLAGGRYYYLSGRLALDGVLQSNVKTLVAEYGGRIAQVTVAPGVRVRAAEPLIRFDDAAPRAALLRAERELQALARSAPPQLLREPGPDGRLESLSERMDRQRLAEEQAERRLQEATDREAQAAVLYSRASMLASQGKLGGRELAGAEAALAAARKETQDARQSFEALSRERADTGARMRHMHEMRLEAGADALPEEAHSQNFERKKEEVARLRAALAAAVITAPEDGLIVDVAVRPGDAVEPMRPCLLFRPDGQPPRVRALIAGNEAGRLKAGQPCRVRFPDGQDLTLDGFVGALTPGLPAGAAAAPGTGAFFAVWIGFVPQNGTGTGAFLPEDGAKAEVTVLLRESPLDPLPASGTMPATGSGGNPKAEGPYPALREGPESAASASVPLSVQTPYGDDPARAGTPAPQEAPKLPPMRAPKHLIGSPLPDPRNNPSLVPSRMLEGGDDRHARP